MSWIVYGKRSSVELFYRSVARSGPTFSTLLQKGLQTSKPEQDVRADLGKERSRSYTRPSAGTLWTLP